MRITATLLVSRATAVRLSGAGDEHGYGMNHMAGVIVTAAARLHEAGRGATALPPPTPVADAIVPVAVAMTDEICAIVADAAAARGTTIEVQIRAILDAGVAGYDPLPPGPARRIEAKIDKVALKRPPAVRKHPTFDPAYYAKHAVAFRI